MKNKHKKTTLKTIWSNKVLYFFIGIFAIISLVFGALPMLTSIYYSLFKTNTIFTAPDFLGLKNYLDLFRDPYFHRSFGVTLLFTVVSVPLNLIVSLALAEGIHYRGIRKVHGIFKLAVFLPYIIPDVVGAVVWKQFFNKEGGMNQLLMALGLEPIGWFTSPVGAFFVLVFVELWKHVGLYTIILLTNYQLIDGSIYEAAHIDGANVVQQYLHVTLPSLRPGIALNLSYSLIQFLKTFTVSKIITMGGPNYATNFISYYAYSKYEKMNFGSATAMATLMFLFIILVTAVFSRLRGEKNESK